MKDSAIYYAPAHLFDVNRRFWIAVLALLLVDAVWLVAAGVQVRIAALPYFGGLIGVCAGIILAYGRLHRDDNLRLFAHSVIQLTLASFGLIVFSFVSARLNLPLWDEALIAADRLLGFDWKAHLEWAQSNETASRYAPWIYNSFVPQVAFFVTLLFACKKPAHAQRFLIAYFATAFVCIVLAALFPAVGGYVYYDTDVQALAHMPVAARIHEAPLLGMRDHSLALITYPDTVGLITFPSFHAAGAPLFIYAAWPFRAMRLFFIALNIAMFLSVLTQGGHYLTDALGGVAIALLCIVGVRRLLPPTRDNI